MPHTRRIVVEAAVLCAAALSANSARPAAVARQARPVQVASVTGGARRARFPWSRAAEGGAHAYYYQPAGLGDDFPEAWRTPAQLRRDFAVMRATGVKLFRCGVAWGSIETGPGRYDWRFWDSLVREAGHNGITLIPYVCYTPEWLGTADDDFWRRPPRDIQRFGDFMYRISARYRGRVRSWELWNEPDNPDFWRGTTEQFAQLTIAGSAGVRRGDPGAAIVLGGLTQGASPFLNDLLTKWRIGDNIDAVDLHGYAETWDLRRAEYYARMIGDVAFAFKSHGTEPDLWLAEIGYGTTRDAAGNLRADVPATYRYEHTPGFQAQALFRDQVIALATGEVSLTCWYRINDLADATNVIGDDTNRHLGIVDRAGRPKPAYYAMRFYDRLFGRPVRSLDSTTLVTGAARSFPPHAVAHTFEDRAGNLIVTAWLPTPAPSEPPADAGGAADKRREDIRIVIGGQVGTTGTSAASLAVYDVSGESVASAAQWVPSTGTLSGIVLTGGSTFVAELRPAHARIAARHR